MFKNLNRKWDRTPEPKRFFVLLNIAIVFCTIGLYTKPIVSIVILLLLLLFRIPYTTKKS